MTNRRRSSQLVLGLAILIFGTAAVAQIPSHAVVLNPTAPDLQDLRMVRSGDTIHAVGLASSGVSTSPNEIHYCRSSDGGRTWPDWSLLGLTWHLGSLVADGARVYVSHYDANVGPMVHRSTDEGTTWSGPVSIASYSAGAPQLHVDGLTLTAVWPITFGGGVGVLAGRSTDGGQTWSANPAPLGIGAPTSFQQQDWNVRVLGEGRVMHVFWNRRTPARYVLYQRSLDGGLTWLPAAQVLASSELVDVVMGHGVLLVQAGSILLRSNDQGATWQPMPGHGFWRPVDLAMAGPNVLAVERVAIAQGSAVRLSASVDAGVTWSAPYVHMTAATFPMIGRVVGDTMFLHERFPSGPVAGWVLQSDDRGATWRVVAGDAGAGFWVWPDGGVVAARAGAGLGTVWAWAFEAHTALGAGSQGTGGIVPRLEGAGLASLGHTFSLAVSEARGGTAGGFFASFGPATMLPLGGATLYLQQPIGPFPFVTTGVGGAAGVGTASLNVTVPPSPGFIGVRLLSQAFVLDPAGQLGFAATRGLESWIR